MIKPAEECLKEVDTYSDTASIVRDLNELLPYLKGQQHYAVLHAIKNLEGMQDLLRSMRHHLVVRHLDNA